MNSRGFILAHRIALPAEPPDRVMLLPWGRTISSSGEMLVDEEAARSILAAFTARGLDLPIDYEHATLGTEMPQFQTPSGIAPAMGWIKSLEIELGKGIFGRIEWTTPGADFLRTKQYRYLSPVTLVDPDTHRAIALHSAALVNKPAIAELPALVNSESIMADERMDWARNWLGLPITATPQEIVMELQELVDQFKAELGAAAGASGEQMLAALKEHMGAAKKAAQSRLAVCKLFGVADGATDEELTTAVHKAKAAPAAVEPDPAKFAPIVVVAAMRTELDALKTETLAKNCAAFIDGGKAAGKIIAANTAMWERAYKASPEQAAKDLETAPVVAPQSGRVVNATAKPHPVAGGDVIVANAERFDPAGMEHHKRVRAVADERKISYSQALELCPA